MEKDRLRKTVLSEVYPNEGERQIGCGPLRVPVAHLRPGYELPGIHLHLQGSQGPVEIWDRRRVYPLW